MKRPKKKRDKFTPVEDVEAWRAVAQWRWQHGDKAGHESAMRLVERLEAAVRRG